MSVFEVYGLRPMTYDEELELPEGERSIRANKKKIYNDSEHIIRIAEGYMRSAKRISETNDDPQIVQEFADTIHKFCEEFILLKEKK